jgi:hypothetical protein
MKNGLAFMTVFSLAGIMLSCKPSLEAGANKAGADSVLTGIERGPCFGKCPEYKAVIYTTGFAEYYGRRNNPRQGYFQCRLSPEKLSEVKSLMKQYHMAEADSEYVNKFLADFPAYWLMVRDAKGSRKVLVNHQEPPYDILDYTVEIDKLVEGLPWKEIVRSGDQ